MKKIINLSLLIVATLTLAACGITEELEQAKNTVTDLKTALTTQGGLYEQLTENVNEIPDALNADLETAPETGLYPDDTGAVYEVISARQELITEMETTNKEITGLKKELQRIVKKKGADVDNKQLKLINQSLNIVISNFASLDVYLTTGSQQEKEFFGELPTEGMNSELSILLRTYGAIEIVSEEAFANLEYTLGLIDTFEKQAPESKAKKK